jgi:hypothetical protein
VAWGRLFVVDRGLRGVSWVLDTVGHLDASWTSVERVSTCRGETALVHWRGWVVGWGGRVATNAMNVVLVIAASDVRRADLGGILMWATAT